MTFKKGGIAITDRDKKLFRYLFVNKVATVEDIRLDIFGHVSLKTVHRRLIKLSHEKLIEAVAQREVGNRMIYSLTKKGFERHIADKSALRRVQLKSDSIDHDLTLLEIKRKFKAFEMVQGFYSENLVRSGMLDDIPEIKSLREIHADGIVKIKIKDRILFIPLEFEASSKYSKRNDKFLAKYYTSFQIPMVIFISKNSLIERRIFQKESQRKTKRKGKLYYCQLADVLESKGKLSFTNVNGETFNIV